MCTRMTDSASTPSTDPEPSAPRPAWRFSGRRGTPVHLREKAATALPKDIVETVTQLARERSGERATPATAPRTTLGTTPTPAPQAASDAVTPEPAPEPAPEAAPAPAEIPIEAVHAPVAETAPPTRSAPPVAAAPMPVERRTATRAAEPTFTPMPEAPPKSPKASRATKPMGEPVRRQAVDEQSRRAKAKARAQAKARAKAKAAKARELAAVEAADEVDPTGPAAPVRTGGRRRIFARSREIVQEAPEAASETLEVPQLDDVLVGVDVTEAAPEPIAAPEPEPELVPEAVIDARIEEVLSLPLPTPEPEIAPESEAQPEAAASVPAPVGAREAAEQAVFDLGKLPILLDAPVEPVAAIEVPDEPVAIDVPDEPVAVEWQAPVPTPAVPDAIQRLDTSLFVPRERARDAHVKTPSPTDTRRRIEARRAELAQLVDELAALAPASAMHE
jgi:hypothetical protein